MPARAPRPGGCGSVGLEREVEMLDLWRHREVRADVRAPLDEERPLAEVDRVVLDRLPPDHEQVPLGRVDAALHLIADEPGRARDRALEAARDRGFEFGVLAGRDVDIGEFVELSVYG